MTKGCRDDQGEAFCTGHLAVGPMRTRATLHLVSKSAMAQLSQREQESAFNQEPRGKKYTSRLENPYSTAHS